MKRRFKLYLFSLSFIMAGISPLRSLAQQEMIVDMSLMDGVEITPDNIFRLNVISTYDRMVTAEIKGSIVYRQSLVTLTYKFTCNLMPGLNTLDAGSLQPQYTFSSTSLRELFLTYRKLPQGLFEYCVQVTPDVHNTEIEQVVFSQCIYQKSEDLFFITLVDPENDAKIYEYNPMLTWMVNYPFAQELKYRIRLTEVKKGQNPVAAITRNNPIYEEGNLFNTGQMYPVYARPLVKDQKYVWTVDAYYKDLLLGGAEPFTFTIVEDSVIYGIQKEPSYVDIRRESGSYDLFAPGKVKIKYELSDARTDSLVFRLYDKDNHEVNLKKELRGLPAQYGDNRFELNFSEHQPLKHMKDYQLVIKNNKKEEFRILFRYVNPDFIR